MGVSAVRGRCERREELDMGGMREQVEHGSMPLKIKIKSVQGMQLKHMSL
jgi:hypothetical protein